MSDGVPSPPFVLRLQVESTADEECSCVRGFVADALRDGPRICFGLAHIALSTASTTC